MTEKKLSGNSDSFGKGDIRGVAAPEAARITPRPAARLSRC